MELLIGPLLERDGGYSYDTFTRADGLRGSFRYPRVDAARYDQRALAAYHGQIRKAAVWHAVSAFST